MVGLRDDLAMRSLEEVLQGTDGLCDWVVEFAVLLLVELHVEQ